MIYSYKYTDSELKQLLSNIVILVDSREQENSHIKDYFTKKSITFQECKLDTGDYSAMLPGNQTFGIYRDLYFPIAIERKNSVDELASTIKDRNRFENELIRSQRLQHFQVVVEDSDGYQNMILGKYRSEYKPKALLGSLKAFESRYGFTTTFISKLATGNYIYHDLLYRVRESFQN
jgi:ERCC4-type nuclease